MALSFLTAACTSAAFFAANTPSYFSDQQITHDVDFGSNNKIKLDIYVPDDNKTERPVIVFFYGGAWKTGSKNDYRFAADAFTQRGYVVVIPDYIKYPKAKFPAWQEDAAKAVAWAHNNIKTYGGDADKLFVVGHSAGAHIGLLLATDNEYLKKEGSNRNWIKAFAGLAGPYHFTPDEPDYVVMFGPPERYKYMQVTNYIDGKQLPMLLLWGKIDKDVGEVNIINLTNKLKEKGGVYEVKYYDNTDHIDIVAALSPIRKSKAPVIEDVDNFFKSIIKQ